MICHFYKSPEEFREWLCKNHGRMNELWVGFYKAAANKKGISYAEALDEALCFGWIDAVHKNIDTNRWMIRFTPRKSTSIWSLVNIRHVRRLTKMGLMMPSGFKAFRERNPKRSKIYSYEVRNHPLAAHYAKIFKTNWKAWSFFRSQAPSYQKVARWWIIRAKKEETRLRRLGQLIKASEKHLRLDRFVSKK